MTWQDAVALLLPLAIFLAAFVGQDRGLRQRRAERDRAERDHLRRLDRYLDERYRRTLRVLPGGKADPPGAA